MRIAFLIRSLERGGAERQLVMLAVGLSRAGHDVSVLTFYGGGALEADLHAEDIPVICLGKSSRWNVLSFFASLVRSVRQIRPHLLHGYLPAGNMLALAVRPFARDLKVVWGVRSSIVELSRFDAVTRLVYRSERSLARFADLIVANSQAGTQHYRHAQDRVPIAVVCNGFDTDTLAPDPDAGARVRRQLGIGLDETVIGFVARLDPMKDHDTFLKAAALAVDRRPKLRFVCVGGGSKDALARLQERTQRLGLSGHVIWTGERGDLRALYNALDLATLASRGEGFPNVVAEAMACGVPCVASDVGAAAEIVGDTGLVVPPGDAAALAQAWTTMLDRLRESDPRLRASTRKRIVERFSGDALTRRTLAAFHAVIDNAAQNQVSIRRRRSGE